MRAELVLSTAQLFNDMGIPMEPFNLHAEREAGFFDATGNYVAYRTDEDKDAWLDALPVRSRAVGAAVPILAGPTSRSMTLAMFVGCAAAATGAQKHCGACAINTAWGCAEQG